FVSLAPARPPLSPPSLPVALPISGPGRAGRLLRSATPPMSPPFTLHFAPHAQGKLCLPASRKPCLAAEKPLEFDRSPAYLRGNCQGVTTRCNLPDRCPATSSSATPPG